DPWLPCLVLVIGRSVSMEARRRRVAFHVPRRHVPLFLRRWRRPAVATVETRTLKSLLGRCVVPDGRCASVTCLSFVQLEVSKCFANGDPRGSRGGGFGGEYGNKNDQRDLNADGRHRNPKRQWRGHKQVAQPGA